jgi:exoribonuclease-2
MFKDNPALLQLKSGMTASVSSSKKIVLVEGITRGTRQAFGFLQADDGQSYFISPPQMSKCLPGDRVTATILEQEDGKTEAIIQSIITPLTGTFIGTVRFRGAHPFIEPENPYMRNWFRIPRIKRDRERDGDIVVADIIKHPFDDGAAHAEILEIVTNERDRSAPWRAACARHRVSFESPIFDVNDVLPTSSKSADHPTMLDHRRVPFVTIDGEYTRDIDDALHAVMLKDGRIRVTVAIADAERYLIPGSKTEKDVLARGFTTYMPGHSVPMLPKVLSEQGASLVEGEERHAVFCVLDINTEGEVVESSFSLGTMASHAKLTYEAVQEFLDGKQDALALVHHNSIKALDELCTRRGLWRDKHALTSSGYSDYRFVVEEFELKSVCRTESIRSQKLVEECMVAANVAFAKFMHERQLPCIYRRHDGIKADKADEMVALLALHGIHADSASIVTLEGYRALMREVDAKQNEQLKLVLRSFQARGCHSLEYGAHFSLGFEGYATFTSPIRKTSDLLNHRSLKTALLNDGQKLEMPQGIIAHLDDRMVSTDRAAKDVQQALYVRLYESKLGTVHKAKVVAVLPAGARVDILDTGASCFISTRSLGRRGDVFDVTPEGFTLMRNGHPLIELGEELDVMIEFVDVASRSINCATHPAR